ncbi:hypothetical protein FG476_10780 [Xylella fastidiosa subsp. multiplex]|uniref:Uncharacterized protein n=1 Tax=Xylella fastidiosa subsp. multiplex TaxID=644357 RepID=A0A9Q4QSZ4_XYLFS|nr:hypothetical protein Xfasm12_0813 [Xylella fastidiosa M12]MBE0268461.1 hypothetical protein [Xylella fastidiosa subsp. multiplex]TNV89194.1 hypothetical protein C5H23_07385 [Xylella fastidiosa]MBE0275312.1 hypothetical protein [Xylella fastidiosa subsp. multiplex]MBE0277485.1 hypothetical protein [Xylella fastidiosa subsp. multiplex]
MGRKCSLYSWDLFEAFDSVLNPRSVGYFGGLSLNRVMIVLDDKVRGVVSAVMVLLLMGRRVLFLVLLCVLCGRFAGHDGLSVVGY